MALSKKVLRCDCGFEVVADTDEELAGGVRRHGLEAHRMRFTAEDALLGALRAEIGRFQRLQRQRARGVKR